ncbi:tRNA N(3)-methylcytidine methyltransferase METTL6 isoform X2 [Phymastichus coffea]|uniref:tRNA N(3)-methylcytidine methyltransferase METTL6 isoform X2 n=1 Tax=Phymastichus coffea TaxID=108790 RepID=UPI00273A7DE0|nr:tRNA N(3)-methylcytidine methyltransferase METTL6 isoform X2 [Phymastichus coffea]
MNSESEESDSCVSHVAKQLTLEEIDKMKAQNSRLVSDFQAMQLEKNAKKHWDLFYKRNEVRFFKDRHWTTREFQELLGLENPKNAQTLLEIGCGVGNLIYPLLEDNINFKKIYACDLSPRAVEFVKGHKLYNPDKVEAFQNDVTVENCFEEVHLPINIATLVFVLSTIHPDKMKSVIKNLYQCMTENGIALFRDYGRFDMAQLRFKPGHKISENFYMRQDGTRSYYFTTEEVQDLFESNGFETVSCIYIQRRTVNLKENIDVPRIFVQGKFMKKLQ